MDDLLALFHLAVHEFGARVHAVRENQWAGSTPDSQWTVADLVEHLIEEHRWAAPLLHGQDLESAAKVVQGFRSLPVDGGVGSNLAQEWDEASIWSAEAFTAPGALEREVALSAGPTPVLRYLREMIFDLVIHAWDLAQAIGYAEPLPDELVTNSYQAVAALDLSEMPAGLFKAPVDVPADAPMIDKLVALTGRAPH